VFFDHLPGAGYVCAHRGARALAPENTLLAAELGLDLGADFWEMDVRMTADGALVVYHDETLSRTTDVAARPEFAHRTPWAVRDFTLGELRRLDAGSWFLSEDPFGTLARGELRPGTAERIRGQRIPTLEEALAFTRRHALPMNLEIKDRKRAPGDSSIVEAVLRQIREADAEGLVLVSSFNHEYLAAMRRLAPDMPLAALVKGRHPEDLVEYLTKLGVAAYHPDKNMVDAELVSRLAGHGVRVTPYTVNDMDRAVSLIDAGCFGIITDFTHTLRQRLIRRV
jgi:glycerophosphoryl diester phosphodiesterase